MPDAVPPFPAEPGDEEVERVVCVSISTVKDAVFAQMEKIRAAALRHNPANGIHAVLLYQSGWFIYWAEGPAVALRKAIEHIRADQRHHSLRIVHFSRGKRLLPTVWSMMMAPSPTTPQEFGLRVQALRFEMDQGRQHSPISAARRLTAPMMLAQARGMADPDAFHRVAVCSAGTSESFALVRWLSEKFGETISRRRVSGIDDRDSGAEYVEFMLDGHPCRVIAISRNSLSYGLTRAMLPDWPYFMLLFAGESRRDHQLMNRVTASCEGLPLTPLLVGIGPDVATHEDMVQRARAHGLAYLNGGLMQPEDCGAIWYVIQEHLRRAGPPASSTWPVLDSRPLG